MLTPTPVNCYKLRERNRWTSSEFCRSGDVQRTPASLPITAFLTTDASDHGETILFNIRNQVATERNRHPQTPVELCCGAGGRAACVRWEVALHRARNL